MIYNGKVAYVLIISAILLIAAIYFYYNYNPTESILFPQCPVKKLTGWSCPACGIQRATHALLNGKIIEALSYNYFFILSIPYCCATFIAYGLKKMNKSRKVILMLEHGNLAMTYVYCFFAWFIIRNLYNI